MTPKDKNSLTFYFPNVRVLSSDDVSALPDEKKKSAETAGRSGV